MKEMAEHIATLRQLIADPALIPTDGWVDEMYGAWPYFTLPSMLRLERGGPMTEERRKELTRRVALNSASPEALYKLIEPMAADVESIYPDSDRGATPGTEEAIDTFINTYGGPGSKEEEILERLIFNPVPDYGLMLAGEEERNLPSDTDAEGDSRDSLINAFILKSRENHGHFPVSDTGEEPAVEQKAGPQPAFEPISPPAMQDDSLLSESLAKIYIKQRRYAKAYEIISGLSLKYPEKSIYFADQLRFLQKLIINQKYLKQK